MPCCKMPYHTLSKTLFANEGFSALRCRFRIRVRIRFRNRFRNRFRKNRVRTYRSVNTVAVCRCRNV